MADPRLDRRPQFDPRSRAFGIAPLRATLPPRSYTWACGPVLDQGREGACVGFSWTHELAAKPVVVVEATTELARNIYHEAQLLDPWEGEAYSGTSVLAGAHAVKARGYLTEYRWAFGIDDLIWAIGRGPGILGISWYEGMFNADADGYLRLTGAVAGGHAILCRGVSLRNRRFLLHNSWGADWGNNGTAWLSFDDASRLLAEQGEACIPVKRALGA